MLQQYLAITASIVTRIAEKLSKICLMMKDFLPLFPPEG
jgi:hypothetical protein